MRDELPQEIKAARRQMDEAFEFMKKNKDDEYDMFGRLLASKLKKIKNPNTRDILMNNIHNLVFRARMADRLEQQSAVPQFSKALSPHIKHSAHHQIIKHPSRLQAPPHPCHHTIKHSAHHQIIRRTSRLHLTMQIVYLQISFQFKLNKRIT